MSFSPDFPAARAALEGSLHTAEFREIERRLAVGGVTTAQIHSLVGACAKRLAEEEWARLEALCGNEDPLLLPRYVLLTTMLAHMERAERFPVVEEVKGRLLDFYLYVCAPDRETEMLLNPRHHGFRAMCRMATLQRFPAGQFDWEIGGVPKSWLWSVRRGDLARLAWTVWGKAGGTRPYFMIHTSYRRDLPIITLEDELHGSRLLAGSMEMQPGIRGVVGASWMLDPELKRVSPHLGWIKDLGDNSRRYGAFLSSIGPAPPDAGYLMGDKRRRRAYESGEWKPVIGVSIWLRQGLLRWLHEEGQRPKG